MIFFEFCKHYKMPRPRQSRIDEIKSMAIQIGWPNDIIELLIGNITLPLFKPKEYTHNKSKSAKSAKL